MRAREMNNRLDRLSGSVDDYEQTCPDISLLSPEDQDRAHELFEKIEGAENEQEFLAKINENTITEAELRELSALVDDLPILGPGDGFKGPSYEIPLELCRYFTHFRRRENEGVHPQFDFHKLKLVQKARFVELCRKYGWEGEYPNADRGPVWKKHRDPVRLLQLSEWDSEDEAQLRSWLDVVEA
jgi:hypothetical protein